MPTNHFFVFKDHCKFFQQFLKNIQQKNITNQKKIIQRNKSMENFMKFQWPWII